MGIGKERQRGEVDEPEEQVTAPLRQTEPLISAVARGWLIWQTHYPCNVEPYSLAGVQA